MNLRQYRRSEVVQAGRVTGVDPALDSVTLADVDDQPLTISSPGLCQGTQPPRVGDTLVLHPDGKASWSSTEIFDREWEGVRGGLLS